MAARVIFNLIVLPRLEANANMKYAMMIKYLTVLLTFLLLCLSDSFCQDNDPVLKIGQKMSIHSEILNETRDVWIYLPPNYTDKYFQAQQYPVLYVLDGDAHFHSLRYL
jgi:hypothetical protein